MTANDLKAISDEELLERLSGLLKKARRVESDLVAHIGEVDERRLYARKACSSMFSYCTEVLHLSEHEAYLRINAARLSRRYPVLLEMLADGRLHLSAIGKLSPYLTDANCQGVLARAAHRSKREVEELAAELAPSRTFRPPSASFRRGRMRIRPANSVRRPALSFSPVRVWLRCCPPAMKSQMSELKRQEAEPRAVRWTCSFAVCRFVV
jgi:hypothetical protein